MNIQHHKITLEKILKLLSSNPMGTKFLLNDVLERRRFARELVRKELRQLKSQEREMKRMAWKKGKRCWTWNNYTIRTLNPLPFQKPKAIQYWLGKKPAYMECAIGLGVFPDIDTAKYVTYVLTKKQL